MIITYLLLYPTKREGKKKSFEQLGENLTLLDRNIIQITGVSKKTKKPIKPRKSKKNPKKPNREKNRLKF